MIQNLDKSDGENRGHGAYVVDMTPDEVIHIVKSGASAASSNRDVFFFARCVRFTAAAAAAAAGERGIFEWNFEVVVSIPRTVVRPN